MVVIDSLFRKKRMMMRCRVCVVVVREIKGLKWSNMKSIVIDKKSITSASRCKTQTSHPQGISSKAQKVTRIVILIKTTLLTNSQELLITSYHLQERRINPIWAKQFTITTSNNIHIHMVILWQQQHSHLNTITQHINLTGKIQTSPLLNIL